MSVEERYLSWLAAMVTEEGFSYGPLLQELHSIVYIYTNPMDYNRAMDGESLRYRFCCEKGEEESELLPGRPCTVLEMMAALALRCEEDVMTDPHYGNRVPAWFWNMLSSMGIVHCDWEDFDPVYIRRAVDRMMNRQYKRNGKGGLFTVQHTDEDMRTIEVWEQMMHYLNERVHEEIIPK